MENKENHVCNMECGGCGHGCNKNHLHVLKWVIKITILVIVFCFAFKIGELKGMLESRGYGDFRNHPGSKMMYSGGTYDMGYGQGMMNQ